MRARVGRALVLIALAAGCHGPAPAPPFASFDPDSVPEAYHGSTAALMWPGASRAFQVRPDGDLYNGAWVVRFDAHADGADASAPRAIAYEERWRPIAHWVRRSGRVRWSFEAVPLPAPGRGDSGLVVSLRLDVTSAAPEPIRATLAVRLTPPDSAPPFVASDEPDPPGEPRWGLRGDRGLVNAIADPADVGSFDGFAFTLAPGATRTMRFVLPAHATEAGTLFDWAGRLPHERRADEARRFWNEAIAHGTRFELGDPETEHAVDAALVLLLANREHRGRDWVPIGAPLHYRDVWLRDGARAIAALAVTGYTREARELAGGLRLLQWPMGPFVSQRGQLDGTGEALWAFDQALLRPAPDARRDRDALRDYAAAALRAFHWCEWQRTLGHQSGWPYGAMVPFGDPRDNELVRAQLVGNDAWTIAGYRSAARLLRAAGRGAEADSVDAALVTYVAEFRAALARSGGRGVPASWQGVGRDWGNLTVAWPARALPADDPRCADLARRVWAASGGAGLCTYGGRDSLHYYLGADLGTWALLTGRQAQADSVLAAMLHWRSASGGAGELFGRDGGYGRNLPPHVTSAAALVMLVRNSLVFDDADTLQLTLGPRAGWWRGSRVHAAPTRWGVIDVAFRRTGDTVDWTWTSVPVWTALSLPAGTRLAQAPAAPFVADAAMRTVLAPPGTAHLSVAVVRTP